MKRILMFGLAIVVVCPSIASAQFSGIGGGQGITVQQPVVSVFNVNTVVSVPDGGTISLGGVNESSYGRVSRGVPLTGAPYLSRAFNNRAIGREIASSNVSVTAKILIMEELDAQVTAEGQRRAALREATNPNPNGTVDTQRKADFISRNIGKSKKK
jgi:type II secretory pathway component GspD/PulD (secretin)